MSFPGLRSTVFAGTVISTVIKFVDRNLESCVRGDMGIRPSQPITVEKARTFTELRCRSLIYLYIKPK